MSESELRASNKPIAAFAHLFTALGVLCAFFATVALIERHYEDMFLWLGAALLIDGFDGALARWLDVAHRLPRFSGERLDLVIDYLTYVFIPALALAQASFLTGFVGTAAAGAILLSSLFHFSDTESKDVAKNFIGFPAIWNLVAFYVFALDMRPSLVLVVIAVGVVLTFVPMRWVHPLRVVALRPLTLAMTVLWLATAAVILWQGFPAGRLATAALLLPGVYVVVLSVLVSMRAGLARRKSP